MRFLRFKDAENQVRYGVLTGQMIRYVKGDIFGVYEATDQICSLEDVQLLAPVEPSKVLCIGLNYQDHAIEFGKPIPAEPLLFLKPSTSVIGPEENIVYPPQTQNLHYEAELAIVIGKKSKKCGAKQSR